MAPGSWCKGELGPDGVNCDECEPYRAFASWYYQGWLINDPSYTSCDIENAPLYLDSYSAASPWDYSMAPLDIKAKLEPWEGLDALRYIPVEVAMGARPPVASARYQINITTGELPEQDADGRVGALFWLTATYDESVFDVRVSFWLRDYVDDGSQQSQCYYLNDCVLCNGRPMIFLGEDSDTKVPCALRIPVMAYKPDCVTVRLKEGRRLEDLGGRKVTLTLHVLSWVGDCDLAAPSGDKLNYGRTSVVQVGADLGEQTNDWALQASGLKDECVPPSFAKVDDKSAEADVIGTRVVKDMNAALPSIRVGPDRFNVARTACLYASQRCGNPPVRGTAGGRLAVGHVCHPERAWGLVCYR